MNPFLIRENYTTAHHQSPGAQIHAEIYDGALSDEIEIREENDECKTRRNNFEEVVFEQIVSLENLSGI